MLWILCLSASLLLAREASVYPKDLRCESEVAPTGVDIDRPILSWYLESVAPESRNVRQTAYQIEVASSPELLKKNKPDLWNSGKVKTDKMGQISYGGKPLLSSRKYWWHVRIWDEKGESSTWSTMSDWTMGILPTEEWTAQWITAQGAEKYALSYKSARRDFNRQRDYAEPQPNAPGPDDPNFSSLLFRHQLQVKPQLHRAIIHMSGLGQYELAINGKKVGDNVLAPGWSDYTKTVLYDTYDVTRQLRAGENTMGIILGNSIYNIQPDRERYVKFLNTYGPLRAILQLRLEYTDGSVETLGTDNTWEVAPGPITYSNLYGGEDYDARLFPEGWENPFSPNRMTWKTAYPCEGPGGVLRGVSGAAPAIRVIEKLEPRKVICINPRVWVYDMGQNASVMPEFTVEGPQGSYIRVIPSELLATDGTVDRTSSTQDGVRPAWWQYTKATDRPESWNSLFFYQGARYFQVELFPAENDTLLPQLQEIKAQVVHTSAQPVGTFSCSNELFNRIYTLVRWAQRSNLMSIITDCPAREKLGWLEQYHLNGPSLRYNYDLQAVFRKGMNDMSDSQLENGFVPNIAPEFFIAINQENSIASGFRNSPEWGSSFIIVPWQQYLFSGDTSLMERYYDRMKRYLAFLEAAAENDILSIGLGDWYDMGPKDPWGSQLTPVALTATAIFYYDNSIMAQTATLLGKKEDARFYENRARSIRESFNKKFFNADTKTYSTNSQTANAMPLFLEITEPENRKAVAEAIVRDIRERGNALTSGDVGYRFLLKALAMEGYSDVIFDMNNQSDRPGYGYQLKMGATSLTEKWNAGVGSFGSQNHFMLGQINEWFFHDLAGIQPDPASPGFRKIILKPTPVGDLKQAQATYQSVCGPISTDWEIKDGKFILQVSIPANTEAKVYVPIAIGNEVSESGIALEKSPGILSVETVPGYIVCEIGSGNYCFETEWIKK